MKEGPGRETAVPVVQPPPATRADQPPGGWRLWWMAARPKTLTISLAPVLVGTAAGWQSGHQLHALPMGAALAGAVLIQIGTNLHNDVADALRGGDQPLRQGPPRVTALGWASPGRVRLAAFIAFSLAVVAGLTLAWVGGWPIIALGIASLVAGWAYSGGPLPIAYSPLGEVFVVAFFGIGAVGGSAWVQTPEQSPAVILTGIAVGLPAAAVLMANNYRDIEPDRLVGRRTLAIRLGPEASRTAFAAMMLAPFLIMPFSVAGAWAGVAALPLAVLRIRDFYAETRGPAFNRILADTARCQLAMAAAMAAGMFIAG